MRDTKNTATNHEMPAATIAGAWLDAWVGRLVDDVRDAGAVATLLERLTLGAVIAERFTTARVLFPVRVTERIGSTSERSDHRRPNDEPPGAEAPGVRGRSNAA